MWKQMTALSGLLIALTACTLPGTREQGPTRTPGPTATPTETPTMAPDSTGEPTRAPRPTDVPPFSDEEEAYRETVVDLTDNLLDRLLLLADLSNEFARDPEVIEQDSWQLEAQNYTDIIGIFTQRINDVSAPPRFREVHSDAVDVFEVCDRAGVAYVESWVNGLNDDLYEDAIADLNGCSLGVDQLYVQYERFGLIEPVEEE